MLYIAKQQNASFLGPCHHGAAIPGLNGSLSDLHIRRNTLSYVSHFYFAVKPNSVSKLYDMKFEKEVGR